MPDPERKSISATQSPALFNASPYLTRWMLYRFLKGDNIEKTATDRMSWGKKLQPLVLEQAQADLHLDINANFSDRYVRAGNLGYTADAIIHCPDRGPGSVESKCVFDYGTWMREWDGGKTVPRHYELQLQQQLWVGDGLGKQFAWGVFAVWVCGEMHYMERRRDDKVGSSLEHEAVIMLDAVHTGREPAPFGAAVEAPILQKLFPPIKGKELDLRSDPAAIKWAELAVMLEDFKKNENFYGKAATDARDKLLALGRDNEIIRLPHGVTVTLSARSMKEHTRKATSWTAIKIERGDDDTPPAEPQTELA